MNRCLLTASRFHVGTAKCATAPHRSRKQMRAVPFHFTLRFLHSPALPRGSRNRGYRLKRPARVAVLCQVGRSDRFYYESDGGAGEDEPFTKDELELAEVIEALEPYDRSAMLPHVSVEAMDAIQKTASGMLGMLPPSQFQVQIRSLRDPLANLVFSSLCTGYALRNAEYRLHLQSSLVVEDRWSSESDKEETVTPLDDATRRKLPLSVLEYIHKIESKLESYQVPHPRPRGTESRDVPEQEKKEQPVEQENRGAPATNRLLQYVRSMDPDSVNKLSESAGRGVVHAFNLTVKKVVENLHLTQAYPSSAKLLGRLRSALGEAEKQRHVPGPSFTSTTFNLSRDNLTDALLWSMLVGYYTKGLESRMALERCLHEKGTKRHSDRAWYLKLGSLFQDEQ